MSYNLKELTYNAISSSMAAIEEFSQSIGEPKNSTKLPIPITVKNTTGWSYGHSKPSSGLVQAVESIIGKKITIEVFDIGLESSIDGICIEKKDSAKILVNKHLNHCWSRIITAKELSHLLMNYADPNLRTETIEEFEDLLQHLSFSFKPKSGTAASEILSYLGATELLLPKNRIDYTKESSVQIAKRAQCPLNIVNARIEQEANQEYVSVYSNPKTNTTLLNLKNKSTIK